MKLNPIAPIGTERVQGFVEYEDKRRSGFEEWDERVYPPPCEEAQRMRKLRSEKSITIRRAAELLDIKPSQVCDLERGRAAPDSWSEVWEAFGAPAAVVPFNRGKKD